MARTRDIKPSFFTNDDLAECSSLARLLFIGLWTIADREGRLQDRPKKIKAEILPYDDGDCDSMLSELERYGFIARYDHNGERFLQIINFGKHQKVHPKENPSVIPAVSRCGNAEPNPEQVSDKDVIDNNQGDNQSPSYSLPSFPSCNLRKEEPKGSSKSATFSVSHETKTEQKKSGITGATGAADADIEAFNAAYPRKTGIGAARSQFTNEIMFKNADPAQMIRAAKAFARKCEKDGTEERFIPKPAKWLSDQCYLDPDLQDDGPKTIAIADMKPWQRAIADQIGAAPTAAWFRDAIWDEPILMMPSKFSADHVSQHYLPQLRRALGAMIIITERKESVA